MVKARSRRGFNLLEVTLAAFIFSIVSIAFAQVWVYHTRAMEKTRHYLVASHLAQSLIEGKMALGYAGVDTGVETDFAEMRTRVQGTDITVRYDYTVTITEMDPSLADKKRAVEVLVKWHDTTNRGEVRLETLLGSAI